MNNSRSNGFEHVRGAGLRCEQLQRAGLRFYQLSKYSSGKFILGIFIRSTIFYIKRKKDYEVDSIKFVTFDNIEIFLIWDTRFGKLEK